jgi:Skp family chaperone for outer membrane proteins
MGLLVRRAASPVVLMSFFVAVAAIGAGAGRLATALHKPPTPVIATVDLEGVYNGLDKRKAKEIEFENKKNEFKTKLDALQAKIEEDKKRYELMPDGPQKKLLGQELIRNALQLKFDGEYAEQFLDQMYGEMLREVYEEVTGACKLLAGKNGYTMIIADDSGARIRGSGRNEVNRLIALKRHLYVDPSHDVTKELIVQMNNDFAASASK